MKIKSAFPHNWSTSLYTFFLHFKQIRASIPSMRNSVMDGQNPGSVRSIPCLWWRNVGSHVITKFSATTNATWTRTIPHPSVRIGQTRANVSRTRAGWWRIAREAAVYALQVWFWNLETMYIYCIRQTLWSHYTIHTPTLIDSCYFKLTWTGIYYCRRQPYFFIEPISKTGHWLGVCHGWFHLQGLPRAERNANRTRSTKKTLVHC